MGVIRLAGSTPVLPRERGRPMLLVILCSVASGIAGIGVGFLIHLRTLVRESVTKRASDALVNELTNVLSQMTADSLRRARTQPQRERR